MQDHFWEERGIAYRTNNFDGSRDTLVFIHGLSPSCSIWAPFENSLESDFNVLTYDLRGHGFSRKYKDYSDYDLTALAGDLSALLDYLHIKSCSLISTSMGTLVALLHIHHHPETVRRSLLLAPVYKQPLPTDSDPRRHPSFLVNLLGSMIPYASRPGTRIDYAKIEHSEEVELRRMVAEIRGLSLRGFLFYLSQMNAFAHHALWSKLCVPTTIIHGTKDSFSPYQSAVDLSKAMSCKLVTLEGANHLLVINNRKEIISEIRDHRI